MNRLFFVLIRVASTCVVSCASVCILVHIVIPTADIKSFYLYGMTVPAAVCAIINATMILILSAFDEGLVTKLAKRDAAILKSAELSEKLVERLIKLEEHK